MLQDLLDSGIVILQAFDSDRSGVFDVGIECPGLDRIARGKKGDGQRPGNRVSVAAELG
jgi:hypothetical protein